MTEYEQFQQFFQKHGVSHDAMLDAAILYEYSAVSLDARHLLRVSQNEYWFDAAGRYLGLRYDDAFDEGHWKPREDSV